MSSLGLRTYENDEHLSSCHTSKLLHLFKSQNIATSMVRSSEVRSNDYRDENKSLLMITRNLKLRYLN